VIVVFASFSADAAFLCHSAALSISAFNCSILLASDPAALSAPTAAKPAHIRGPLKSIALPALQASMTAVNFEALPLSSLAREE
jgi:hypothetical protein